MKNRSDAIARARMGGVARAYPSCDTASIVVNVVNPILQLYLALARSPRIPILVRNRLLYPFAHAHEIKYYTGPEQ